MKICFIVGSFPTMKCGVGDYTHRLSEELARKGNEVHIITSNKANPKSDLLHIHNIVEKWDMSAFKGIMSKLKEIKPDMVNIQYPGFEYNKNLVVSILPIEIKRKLKCKVTATLHEYECFTLKSKIRLYINFLKLDKIIVAEEEFIEKIKKDFKKTDIIYIPISSNVPKSKITQEKKKELLEKYNLTDKKVISYFGFAVPTKGIEYLLESVSKLDDDVKLLFIGELDSNNEYQKSLLDLIEKLEIKEKVILTGFFEDEKDVADLLEISNVCVLPFVEGVKTRNGSFLASYNQTIKVVTTSNNLEDKNGIYYAKPKSTEELLKKINYALQDKTEFEREELTWEKVRYKLYRKF